MIRVERITQSVRTVNLKGRGYLKERNKGIEQSRNTQKGRVGQDERKDSSGLTCTNIKMNWRSTENMTAGW